MRGRGRGPIRGSGEPRRHVQRTIGTSFDAIAPLHTLARVRCPVLLVHGTADATVPFEDARRLAAVCAAAALLPVDGGMATRIG